MDDKGIIINYRFVSSGSINTPDFWAWLCIFFFSCGRKHLLRGLSPVHNKKIGITIKCSPGQDTVGRVIAGATRRWTQQGLLWFLLSSPFFFRNAALVASEKLTRPRGRQDGPVFVLPVVVLICLFLTRSFAAPSRRAGLCCASLSWMNTGNYAPLCLNLASSWQIMKKKIFI